MERLFTLSLRYRFFTLVATGFIIVIGLWSFFTSRLTPCRI